MRCASTMESKPLPDFLHVGAQKAGSTWIHYALKEHPDIFMPDNDNVSFFDVYYHRGEDWYKKQFDAYQGEIAIGEESPGYLKHPIAPQRAADLVPDVKIIMCLRNPIDRAYSQWWHAQKNWTNTDFQRSINYHATNDVFITPGLYEYHISKWENYFPTSQIKIVFFDDFISDNKSFIQNIYDFIGVDSKYSPSIIGEKIKSGEDLNEPSVLYDKRNQIRDGIRKYTPEILKEYLLSPLYHKYSSNFFNFYKKIIDPVGRSGYNEGMDADTRRELERVYYDSIKKLENRTGRDLSQWFRFIDA